jgi:DNA (cytosine-5)-methyltransferase 1
MTYPEELADLLRPRGPGKPLVLDLFAGCGGLALGFEACGFETIGYEMDENCCATYRQNLNGDCVQIKLTPEYHFPKAKVVIGGPPCQPFSVGGLQRGIEDSRDGFPVFISAIQQAQPDIWMFENVRGLLYRNKPYLDEIVGVLEDLGYVIEYRLLNAVNYGVPQNRERVIVVGHRGTFKFPTQITHITTAGQALGELATSIPETVKFLTPSMDAYVEKYEKASSCINPRDLYLDRPARTVTCRNLAGATGDMHRIRLPDGRRRRLTIQEAARLQSFPDWFKFVGNEISVFNQIGNAVPPLLAYHMAKCFHDYLNGSFRLTKKEIQVRRIPLQMGLQI